jgi:hypothetical protein
MTFRFPDTTNWAYMKLPYDGSDIHALHHFQTGSDEQATELVINALAVHDEDLYVFDESENDQGVVDAEWAEENIEKFWAFISLTTGRILLTHRDELVVPLCAEVTVEDMRSPK